MRARESDRAHEIQACQEVTQKYSKKLLRATRAQIGRNIHQARAGRKMMLSKLAKLSGVPAEKIDRYELGKCDIRLDDLLRMVCALDVRLSRLMDGAGVGMFDDLPRFLDDFTRYQPRFTRSHGSQSPIAHCNM